MLLIEDFGSDLMTSLYDFGYLLCVLYRFFKKSLITESLKKHRMNSIYVVSIIQVRIILF